MIRKEGAFRGRGGGNFRGGSRGGGFRGGRGGGITEITFNRVWRKQGKRLLN